MLVLFVLACLPCLCLCVDTYPKGHRLLSQYQYVLGASLQAPDPAVPGAFTFCPTDAGAITQWNTDVEGLFDTDRGGG